MKINNLPRTTNNIKKDIESKLEMSLCVLFMVMILFSLIGSSISVQAVPQGPTIIYNRTDNVTPRPAAQITTAGGSFTTLLLNATTQTPRWKAYVGNVTGKLVLDDSNQKSIFDWRLASVTGEVYATRGSVDWSTIACANDATVLSEDSVMNMSVVNPDTINQTFSNRVHRSFYVGSVLIHNSTCPSIATYINDTAQASSENALFQEILLQDSTDRLVYSTLVNQNSSGYNNQRYDFQMIVAENEYQTTPTAYYMYAELI
jgi:hypothetical protein